MTARRITVHQIQQMKVRREPIAMVTAYDYTAAKIIDRTNIPMVLVGDSMGQVVLGYDSTIPVTVEDIVRATSSVVRGTKKSLVVADMPFLSYQIDPNTALKNAGKLIQKGGAHAVKLEGGLSVTPVVKKLTESGMAVMGHIGLTPQSVHQLGGYRVQGKSKIAAKQLLEDAVSLQEAGVFSIVLELIPSELAEEISGNLEIPTIGIGAGIHCDGQVQVFHDILGLDPDFRPKHSGNYANLSPIIQQALQNYSNEVTSRKFPTNEQTFSRSKDNKNNKSHK